jgi:uncharacterized protein YcbX
MLMPPSIVILVSSFFWATLIPANAAALVFSSATTSSSVTQAATSSASLGTVTGLFRHAVKGLSADALTSVNFQQANEAFPDDRRFALLYQKHQDKFQENDPKWLHKENFLCAFTAPKLFSRYEASYQLHQKLNSLSEGQSLSSHPSLLTYGNPADVVEMIDSAVADRTVHRWLTLRERATNGLVLGPVDLSTASGREALADFFAIQSGQSVVCVAQQPEQQQHSHQFGNTSSGVKLRQGDTRTMHIVNAATIRDITARTGVRLNPTRFRPNIVIDGVEPWSEFEWIGKQVQMGPSCQMSILTRTVRCEGVSIDPLDPDDVLDIPQLLIANYPEHGPFLGVYAALDVPGTLALGDSITLCTAP